MARKQRSSGYGGIPPLGPKAEDMEKRHKYEPPEGKDNRKMMFVLIGILLVLIVVGVSVLIFLFMGQLAPPIPPDIKPNVTVPENLTNVTPPGCDDSCLLQVAINTSSVSFCGKINDSSMQQSCYTHFSNDSLSACLKIEDATKLRECVSYHAVLNDDIGICSNLDGPDKDSCLAQVDICHEKQGTRRDLCDALSKNDPGLCKGDEECIFNYSFTTGIPGSCEALGDVVTEQACKSYVLDQDLCYDLPRQAEKDLCYQIYAIKSDDSVVCSAIYPDTLYALECYSHFSVEKSDLSLCDGLSLNNRWACYTNYSFGTKDISGCVSIHRLATTARFKCFFEYAKSYGDPSACDLINVTAQTTTCYVGSILNNTNLNYETCKDVVRIQWKNKCYMESAIMNNDSSLCDYIETELERKSCLNEFR